MIFAAVFGVLAAGIQILFGKFLSSDDEISPAAETASAPKSGQTVDIVIEDETLPTDSNTPQFFVGTNRRMLKEEDMTAGNEAASASSSQPLTAPQETAAGAARQNAAPAAAAVQNAAPSAAARPSAGSQGREPPAASRPAASVPPEAAAAVSPAPAASGGNDGFIPMPLQETAENLSGTEALASGGSGASVSPSGSLESLPESGGGDSASGGAGAASGDLNDGLDTLPELSDIEYGDPDSGGDGDTFISEDDLPDDDEGGNTVSLRHGREISGDAELMAKAISTVLAKE